jgi:drug/metabolite transporter (DMT)-like permease
MGWGIVGHTFNQLAFLSGLRLTTATNSALIFGNLPVVVALLGVLAGAERPRPRTWAGIVLGTAGVAIVVGAKASSSTRQPDGATSSMCWGSSSGPCSQWASGKRR